MSEKKMYEVIITNEILGNSSRIMSFEQIMEYNVCAEGCARKVALDGKPHTWGMWTVKPAAAVKALKGAKR